MAITTAATYSESAQGIVISRSRAIAEMDAHGIEACDYSERSYVYVR